MRVITIAPRGYCHGVVAAIEAVRRALADPTVPRPIHVLGMIVHNRFVVERFAADGVITLDAPGKTRLELLEGVRTGTVVVTAHGVGAEVYGRIRAKGLHLIDATCGDVLRTHRELARRRSEGFALAFIGRQGHPETEGVLAMGDVVLIDSVATAESVRLPAEPLFVATQTTFSIRDVRPIVAALRSRRPDLVLGEEICDATRARQEAVVRDAAGADLLLVVGDPHSNNTENLVRIGREQAGVRSERVESVEAIDPAWLQGVRTVAVTSGASTPTDVTAAVIAFLRRYGTVEPPSR